MRKKIEKSKILTFGRADFIFCYVKFVCKKSLKKILRKDIVKADYGREILLPDEANEQLYEMINCGKPFMVGRFGSTEMNSIIQVIKSELKLGKIRDIERKSLFINAGFFPNDEAHFKEFAELNLSLCSDIDILAILNSRLEDYVVKRYMKTTRVASLIFIEPYYFEKPWSRALRGKKVLVIHPFSETIKAQYQKSEMLFENKEILPPFELITLKAVQTIAGNKTEFRTWFDALNYMFEKAMSIDFDVAIIGCGAYGLPLALKLKQAGKQAIHMGGATQILFGIKGGRWDHHTVISKLYNQNWIRPGKEEIPEGSNLVEAACYW